MFIKDTNKLIKDNKWDINKNQTTIITQQNHQLWNQYKVIDILLHCWIVWKVLVQKYDKRIKTKKEIDQEDYKREVDIADKGGQ